MQKINAIDFSENSECMCVALSNGFAVFQTNPLKLNFYRQFPDKQIGKAVTIPGSSIIVCTGVSGQRSFSDKTVIVFDESLGRSVLEINLPDPVKRIKMYPSMFSVTTRSEMRLYTFDPPMLYCQFINTPNESAPSDLVWHRGAQQVALTGRDLSTVRIVSGTTSDFSFKAHNHGVSMVKMNSDGNYIATASETGTCIRLWRCENGEKVAEFRRGRLSTQITSLEFDPRLQLLSVASTNPTLHVFQIPPSTKTQQPQEEMTWKNPEQGLSYISFDKSGHLLVGTQNGSLFVLRYDITNKTIIQESITLFTTLLNSSPSSSGH